MDGTTVGWIPDRNDKGYKSKYSTLFRIMKKINIRFRLKQDLPCLIFQRVSQYFQRGFCILFRRSFSNLNLLSHPIIPLFFSSHLIYPILSDPIPSDPVLYYNTLPLRPLSPLLLTISYTSLTTLFLLHLHFLTSLLLLHPTNPSLRPIPSFPYFASPPLLSSTPSSTTSPILNILPHSMTLLYFSSLLSYFPSLLSYFPSTTPAVFSYFPSPISI